MLKTVLLSTAALALITTAATAGPQITLSHDNRFVSVLPSKASKVVPHFALDTTYLYSTIAKNPEGAYFCCYGSTISGPTSFFGHAYGIAEQFIPATSGSVTKLVAGVGYVSGDHKVKLTLYADNGSNEPGTMLAQGKGTTSTAFGFCCGLTTAKIPSTNLTAGTPYWVAITAGGSDFDAAGFQVSDEVDNPVYTAGTSNGGTTWGTSASNTEYNPAIGVK